MPFFSIIISIYNKSSWIKNIDLILNQTFDNYEILIINDGSTDNSADICKDLAFFDFVHLRFIRNVLYNRNPTYSSETLRRFFNRISTDEDILQSINYINLNNFSDLSNLDHVYIKVISNKSQNKFF